MHKVKDEPGLIKSEFGVIHNVNIGEYESYINKRNSTIQSQLRIEALEKDNLEIKESLSLIIKILQDKK